MSEMDMVCAHFRTKEMVHRGEQLVRTPETVSFPYCWCTRTLTDLGPDEGLVCLNRCQSSRRSCFKSIQRRCEGAVVSLDRMGNEIRNLEAER